MIYSKNNMMNDNYLPYNGLPDPYPYNIDDDDAIPEYIAGSIEWFNLDLRDKNIELPVHCTAFTCDNCNLTSLPVLPNNGRFDTLSCAHNHLTMLPVLPDTLKWLNCERNNLTILPDLPPSLIGFHFSHNPLEINYPDLHVIQQPNHTLIDNILLQNDMLPQENRVSIHTLIRPIMTEKTYEIVCYINRRNAMMRAKDRMHLIDPTNQLLERYMRRAMHPSRLQPLLDNTDLDVDEFMTQYTNSL
jgi:hypothetical protein